MSLCINPYCFEPDHAGNDGSRYCQSCGSDLILQQRYRVLRLISDKSGFGKVYEAYERSTPKILKILKDNFSSNEKAVELFRQEALVLAQLRHPGIPLIEPNGYFEFQPRGRSQVLHCLIMEKIDGPNLREWMRQQGHNPIGERQALDWLFQTVGILHLVHQKNYFHRDIKPENIMLRSSGQLVLVDFGAAREMTYTYLAQIGSGSSGVTRISSAGYTPPEQEYGQAVPQSDFYALGRTFIYLLTGKLPSDPSIYDPIDNSFRWRQHATHISADLGNFIDWLIAPKVSDRPQTTQQILDALEPLTNRALTPTAPLTFASNLTLPQTTGGPATYAQSVATLPQGKSNQPRWWMGGIAALVVALGGFAGWTIWQESKPSDAPIEAQVIPSKTLIGHTGSINALMISPGERSLVSASSDGTVKLWDLQLGELLRTLVGHTSFVNTVAVTPDGQAIVSGGADKTLRIWDAQTGEQLRALTGQTSFINTVIVSHEGNSLFSGGADGKICVWDWATGALRTTLTGHAAAVNSLVMSRDGKLLISGAADTTVKIWDTTTQSAIRDLKGHSGPVNSVLVSSDSRYVISAGADGQIMVWDINTGQLLRTLTGHDGSVDWILLSDDGQTLYSGGADKTLRAWNFETGELLETLTGFDSSVHRFAIASGGQTVITNRGSHDLEIWEMPTEP